MKCVTDYTITELCIGLSSDILHDGIFPQKYANKMKYVLDGV